MALMTNGSGKHIRGRPPVEVAPPGVIIKGGADPKGRRSIVQR
jgi:hypothetical protein